MIALSSTRTAIKLFSLLSIFESRFQLKLNPVSIIPVLEPELGLVGIGFGSSLVESSDNEAFDN